MKQMNKGFHAKKRITDFYARNKINKKLKSLANHLQVAIRHLTEAALSFLL